MEYKLYKSRIRYSNLEQMLQKVYKPLVTYSILQGPEKKFSVQTILHFKFFLPLNPGPFQPTYEIFLKTHIVLTLFKQNLENILGA